jgi:transglutaminase-like putative cysteine protease
MQRGIDWWEPFTPTDPEVVMAKLVPLDSTCRIANPERYRIRTGTTTVDIPKERAFGDLIEGKDVEVYTNKGWRKAKIR